jgi:hypothetical protein
MRVLDSIRQDIRHTARAWRRAPGSTAAAIATLALGIAAYDIVEFALARRPGEPSRYIAGWGVSTNFFSALGVAPALGRGFDDQRDRTAGPVAVISHQLWDRAFQRDPSIIGTEVQLSGRPATIVGVAPERFTGTELYFHPDTDRQDRPAVVVINETWRTDTGRPATRWERSSGCPTMPGDCLDRPR